MQRNDGGKVGDNGIGREGCRSGGRTGTCGRCVELESAYLVKAPTLEHHHQMSLKADFPPQDNNIVISLDVVTNVYSYGLNVTQQTCPHCRGLKGRRSDGPRQRTYRCHLKARNLSATRRLAHQGHPRARQSLSLQEVQMYVFCALVGKRFSADKLAQPPDKQISQIEKSVTHLLVATKQLLETLTQWSRKQATEGEVSDVYVRLGYEFNLACRAFSSIGVETADLGPVPDLLRAILEDTLSQDASPQSLDQYLPKIRDIIINLLQGLKRKQAKLRNRSHRDTKSGSSSTLPNRQTSGGSVGSNEGGLAQMMDQSQTQESQVQTEGRYESPNFLDGQNNTTRLAPAGTPGRTTPTAQNPARSDSRKANGFNSSSSLSSNTMQNLPVLSPYTEAENSNIPPGFPPPPPAPKQQDALAALQRGGDLERRASRRFSAYQISKHLGASNGMPVLPPSQTTPIPNRGRDMRESMNAVRSRGSVLHSRQKSNPRVGDSSPNRPIQGSDLIAEEATELKAPPRIVPPDNAPVDDSPTTKTPEDKYGVRPQRFAEAPSLGATVTGPLPTVPEPVGDVDQTVMEPAKGRYLAKQTEAGYKAPEAETDVARTVETPIARLQQFTPEDSPPPGKELTLFLQYKSKIKKFVLNEGYNELTIARLQLAFIEKFAWNTQDNGVELPEIYIQDPVSGVRHELEDLNDVKDRSVLVLNVEVLDEVKKHIDDGLDGIRQMLEGVRGAVGSQEALMQRFADRQLETAKDMARIAAVPPQTPGVTATPGKQLGVHSSATSAATLTEVQSLRREIAVLRQSYSTMATDFTDSMQKIKAKGANVKKVAANAAIPTFAGNAGRAHIDNGKKVLQKDSERLVGRVDDLQDLIDDLRKDVVTRGVRPLPRQLEDVSKDISATMKELTKLKDFMKKEEPIWKKIWQKELELVCEEQNELSQQEGLLSDLTVDIEELSDIFKLVEEATKQQNLQNGPASAARSTSRNLPIDPYVDPQQAKDGVLGEVRALRPNHENRLEAIERAERVRQKELESRKGGEFQQEIASFVGESKLKKTGGADEVERLRKLRDEKARKENWDRAAARKAEMEEKERQEAMAASQPPSADGVGERSNGVEGDPVSEETADKFDGVLDTSVEGSNQSGESSPNASQRPHFTNHAFQDPTQAPQRAGPRGCHLSSALRQFLFGLLWLGH